LLGVAEQPAKRREGFKIELGYGKMIKYGEEGEKEQPSQDK